MIPIITWPEQNVRDVLSGILTAVGREFQIIFKSSGTPCSICLSSGYYDPVTDSSINSFCPSCYGLYYINASSGISISGHIRWINSETSRWYPGGQIPDGDCIITVAYSNEIRSYLERSKYFIVDDKNLSLKGYTPKGAKVPNRIIITLVQEGN